MKILVTGGFGYIGGRLAQFLSAQGKYDLFLGSRQRLDSSPWTPQAKVIQTQWNSLSQLESICAGIDTIVHLAGMNAQDCVLNPIAAFDVNASNTVRIVQSAIHQGVKRFIYLSTAHVYSNPLIGIINEKTPLTNMHPYATSHLAGENAVREAHQQGEIEGIVIRLSNAFGAPIHKNVNCWMLLVNDLCRQALTNQRMILQSAGLQRRDFIPLSDVCRAIQHLIELPADKLDDGVFNIGGMRSQTILEMTNLVADRVHIIAGYRPEIVCKADSSIRISEPFEYQISKLIDTGFSLSEAHCVQREIDGVIQFCLCSR